MQINGIEMLPKRTATRIVALIADAIAFGLNLTEAVLSISRSQEEDFWGSEYVKVEFTYLRDGKMTCISFMSKPGRIISSHLRHELEYATQKHTPSHFDLLTPAARKYVNSLYVFSDWGHDGDECLYNPYNDPKNGPEWVAEVNAKVERILDAWGIDPTENPKLWETLLDSNGYYDLMDMYEDAFEQEDEQWAEWDKYDLPSHSGMGVRTRNKSRSAHLRKVRSLNQRDILPCFASVA